MSLRALFALLFLFAAACSKEENAAPDATAVADAGVRADAGGGGLPDAAEDPDAGVEPYTLTVFDSARISSHGEDPNFHHVRAELDFAHGPFAEVKMILGLSLIHI